MEPPAQEEKQEGNESMEEILHSIKKIISEDGDEAGAKKGKKNGNKVAKEAVADDVPGSDVLELTEVVEEKPAASAKPVVEAPKAENKDVLSQIDAAVGPAETKAPVPPAPAAKPREVKPAMSSAPGDPMLSDDAVAAVSASVDKLKKSNEPPPIMTSPFPNFESGSSVETMVANMLRPMIKEWLDRNLPAVVERIVEQEIKRITK